MPQVKHYTVITKKLENIKDNIKAKMNYIDLVTKQKVTY